MVSILDMLGQKQFKHDLLEFDELECVTNPDGRYYVSPTGERLHSVTTFLGKTKSEEAKRGLETWRRSVGYEEAKRISEEACVRGEAVHLAAEYHIRNRNPNDVKIVAGKYYSLYDKMKNKLNCIDNVRALEIPLYSEILKLAGRVDCVADYKGVPSVIDFKTSINLKSEDRVQDYKLQACIYSIMLKEMYGLDFPQLVIIIAVENDPRSQVYVWERDMETVNEISRRIKQFRSEI